MIRPKRPSILACLRAHARAAATVAVAGSEAAAGRRLACRDTLPPLNEITKRGENLQL